MKKKCQVIMLPSENKSEIIGNRQFAVTAQTGELKLRKDCSDAWINSFWKNKWINYNLYVLSNEDLKKGDWCFHKASKSIVQYPDCGYPKDHALKVIATTDKTLTYTHKGVQQNRTFNYPEISSEFIEKFVESYNDGKIITEVEVDFDKVWSTHIDFDITDSTFTPKVKVDQNNFISITTTKPKESWTREEVVTLLYKSRFHKDSSDEKFDEWVNNNVN